MIPDGLRRTANVETPDGSRRAANVETPDGSRRAAKVDDTGRLAPCR
jgi:hypothetical protein